jgi:hypothetical protein
LIPDVARFLVSDFPVRDKCRVPVPVLVHVAGGNRANSLCAGTGTGTWVIG